MAANGKYDEKAPCFQKRSKFHCFFGHFRALFYNNFTITFEFVFFRKNSVKFRQIGGPILENIQDLPKELGVLKHQTPDKRNDRLFITFLPHKGKIEENTIRVPDHLGGALETHYFCKEGIIMEV